MCVPEHAVVVVPATVDPSAAVCLPLNYVTAYQLLHRVARVTQGQQILVHGAAGGVGTALLELGKLAGATLFGTASPRKHALVRQLGAVPFTYENHEWIAQMRNIGGMHAVFDPIGGRHFWQSAQTLRRGGHLVAYGSSSIVQRQGQMLLDWALQVASIHAWNLLPNGTRASFYDIRQFRGQYPRWYHDDLQTLLQLLVARSIRPHIAHEFPLQDVAHAHKLVETSQVQGKIVLLPQR